MRFLNLSNCELIDSEEIIGPVILTIPVPGMKIPRSTKVKMSSSHNKITYKVRRGDTLGHIAEDYSTRASKIRQWNGMKYGQHIFPGQKLTLWVKK